LDEQLSNWYVRLCRRRFWKGEYATDKISAYQTLYECLETLTRLMAPISPFFSDLLFRELNAVTNRHAVDSVHLADFPVSDPACIDSGLEERMRWAQDASSLVLSLRKKVKINVRQPLQKMMIPVLDPNMKKQLERVADLIKAEVNVKELDYLDPNNTFIRKKIKPNFIALGKKLGPKMKAMSAALAAFSQEDIAALEQYGYKDVLLEGEIFQLQVGEADITSEDVPGWTVASKGRITVALDLNLTPELVAEGQARELVNRIQKIRKDSGFELTDRVSVSVFAPSGLAESFGRFKDYICAEILADDLSFESGPQAQEIEINGENLTVTVNKKG
jgi:isoleucyl-tRNA synthetase